MADVGARTRTWLPAWFGPFAPRPRLVASGLAGVIVGFAASRLSALTWVTSSILGWDTLCIGFVGSCLLGLMSETPERIRERADQDDERRAAILTLALTAAVASVVAVAMELSLARETHGIERVLRVTLAFVTVTTSWFLAQTMFALHYAHAYYDREEAGGSDAGGLRFPDDELPDYWDFLHFSVIIGVASQTADIAITSKSMRRLSTVHSLFAFAFNTVIVALTINLLAGLFG